MLFHLCVSISPMMALQTQQFHSVRRDQVMAVSVSHSELQYYAIDEQHGQTAVCLGNQPPKYLSETERLLWKCVFKVMRGSTGLVELSNFIQGYQELAAKFSEKDIEADWFSISRE
jgi:hypothetical protein